MRKNKPILTLDFKEYLKDFGSKWGYYGYRGYLFAFLPEQWLPSNITKSSLLASICYLWGIGKHPSKFGENTEVYEVLRRRIEYNVNTQFHPNLKIELGLKKCVQAGLGIVSKYEGDKAMPQSLQPWEISTFILCGGKWDYRRTDFTHQLLWDYDKNVVPQLFDKKAEELEDKFPLFFFLRSKNYKKKTYNLYIHELPSQDRCPNPKRFEYFLTGFDYSKFYETGDVELVKAELRKDNICETCVDIYNSIHCFELAKILRRYAVGYRIGRKYRR